MSRSSRSESIAHTHGLRESRRSLVERGTRSRTSDTGARADIDTDKDIAVNMETGGQASISLDQTFGLNEETHVQKGVGVQVRRGNMAKRAEEDQAEDEDGDGSGDGNGDRDEDVDGYGVDETERRGVGSSSTGKGNKKGPLSCAECRRLKLKCDRQVITSVPCANCVRRKCADLCPDGVKPKRKQKTSIDSGNIQAELLVSISDLLSQHGMALQTSSSGGDFTLVPLSDASASGSASTVTDLNSHPNYSLRPSQPRLSLDGSLPDSIAFHPASSAVSHPNAYPGSQPVPTHTVVRRRSTSRGQRRSRSPDREWNRSSLAYPETGFMAHRQPSIGPSPIRFEYNIPSNLSAHSVSTSAVSTHPHLGALDDEFVPSPHEESHGTLVLGKSGRSRYLGPTAGPEWLKDQGNNPDKTPAVSRAHSPGRLSGPSESLFAQAFPFDGAFSSDSAEDIMAMLPPEDHGQALLDAYYRYFAWNHNPAPRPTLQGIFDEVYTLFPSFSPPSTSLRRIGYQRLALLFIVFALGAVHSLEVSPHDSSAESYLSLTKRCLSKGDFMRNNTVAGVQALNIMGHFYLDMEKGRDGESAWPIWGLVMRIIQAMGLHRDGERWNLPSEVIEERRMVFWECYSIEIFQSNCNSRPSSLQRRHIDTKLPHDLARPTVRKSFVSVKYELAQISHEIIDRAMDVTSPPYSDVQRLYAKLCAFERSVPFHLRCRPAALATTSVYLDAGLAIRDTPEVDKRDLKRTLERFTLALNISENFLFLQRPYFVRAIHEHLADPIQSPFGDAYLAVVERATIIITVVKGVYELYPEISSRHWFYWYHLFTAAVCLGTIPIKSPLNPLAQYALVQLNAATAVYNSLRQRLGTQAISQNHEWLCRLQVRAQAQIQASSTGLANLSMPGILAGRSPEDEQIDDSSLLSWRTRLIHHAAHALPRSNAAASMDIGPSVLPMGTAPAEPIGNVAPVESGGNMATNTAGVQGLPFATQEGISTGDLLQQLWDEMLQPGARTEAADLVSFTSWNWDSGLDALMEGNEPEQEQ